MLQIMTANTERDQVINFIIAEVVAMFYMMNS
jgi:hypothetical protein